MKTVYMPEDIKMMDASEIAAGRDEYDLIEKAGQHIAHTVREVKDSRAVLFFCGRGNNGADGFAAARMLSESHTCTALVLAKRNDIIGAAGRHMQEAMDNGVKTVFVSDEGHLDSIDFIGYDVVVDALLGTGATRFPKGLMAHAIKKINGMRCPVIAVDVPTGVLPHSGQAGKPCVKADKTITMQGIKPGLLLYPGADYAGEVIVAHAFDTQYQPMRRRFVFGAEDVLPMARERNTHKGSYGKLGIIAGSRGYSGAGVLCVRSALRSGCGMVTAAAPAGTVPVYRNNCIEAMSCALPEEDGGYGDCKEQISGFLASKDACVIGPGMGRGVGVEGAVRTALKGHIPLVLDADALNALAGSNASLLQMAHLPIVTPHPAELARLLGCALDEVLQDPVAQAEKFAVLYQCICVLKLSITVIASPEKTAFVTTGCAGMAKGGSGDVLAGCMGSILAARPEEPFYAACFAAYACGKAGEYAQEELGATFMQPGDTINHLSQVFREFE